MPTPTTHADLAPVAPATLHVALALGNTTWCFAKTDRLDAAALLRLLFRYTPG